jgi:hypothetical protein
VDPTTAFGAGFKSAFDADPFEDPVDPDTIAIDAVNVSADPTEVPDPD